MSTHLRIDPLALEMLCVSVRSQELQAYGRTKIEKTWLELSEAARGMTRAEVLRVLENETIPLLEYETPPNALDTPAQHLNQMEHLSLLRVALQDLAHQLEDPQPGLFTWGDLANKRAKHIAMLMKKSGLLHSDG